MSPDLISRRNWLTGVGAVGLGSLASSLNAEEQEVSSQHPLNEKAKPRNVIFMVADGMSLGVPTLADPFSKILYDRGTAWTQLINNPKATHGFLETRSGNSIVTDSAAAASAWGSGHAINNGALNVSPTGEKLAPITKLLRDQGYKTGLVTTDKVTGATPSGFAINQANRRDYEDIAPQFLDNVDVLMGGGLKYFEAGERSDKRNVLVEYQSSGFRLCESRNDLQRVSSSDKVLGLFSNDAMPYMVDLLNADSIAPTLSEMTQSALSCLSDTEKGFFLMVEGARVDHAAHSNDAAALLHEQIAFEDALETALTFAADRDDTLILVTSDHGNANPGLNGFGPSYTKTDESFRRLSKVTASFDVIRNRVRETSQEQGVETAAKNVLGELCGIEVESKVSKIVGEALVNGKLPSELSILQRSWVGVLSQVMGNHTAIGFTGVNHTADHVLLSSIGPSSERFDGLKRHTHVFHLLMELLS